MVGRRPDKLPDKLPEKLPEQLPENLPVPPINYKEDKSMIKSKLDDIPGIGTTKKALLLKKFGDIEKIAKASIKDLTEVKGINEQLAQEILDFLN